MKLFSEKGFNGTTTKEIAELAEVNEALIFRHFSTKRELYGAIIERKIHEEPGIELSLETNRDSKDDRLMFTAIASRMFEKCGRDPSFMRLLHFSALEGHDLSDMFFDTYVEYINTLLSDYIDTRISDGAFKNLSPLYSSKAFIGMVVNQIIVQELFMEKRKNNINLDIMIATFVEIFLEGIKSRGL
jgi:AcrR family transcriptional regulator